MSVKLILLVLVGLHILFFIKCEEPKSKESHVQLSETGNSEELERIFASNQFDPQKTYGPISLSIDLKPFIKLGQRIEELDKRLSLQKDVNGRYSEKSALIVDYFSADTDLSAKIKEGSINGILFFSADRKKGEIFDISGSWTIDANLEDENSKLEVEKAIVDKLFPVLEGKLQIKPNWSYAIENATLIEHFKISQPGESQAYWKLNYSVEPK
jgi:hypothetical protein